MNMSGRSCDSVLVRLLAEDVNADLEKLTHLGIVVSYPVHVLVLLDLLVDIPHMVRYRKGWTR